MLAITTWVAPAQRPKFSAVKQRTASLVLATAQVDRAQPEFTRGWRDDGVLIYSTPTTNVSIS